MELTFGYNNDKTMRINDTSLPSSEVSALDALVARVPRVTATDLRGVATRMRIERL
jgi:hypothetical protein